MDRACNHSGADPHSGTIVPREGDILLSMEWTTYCLGTLRYGNHQPDVRERKPHFPLMFVMLLMLWLRQHSSFCCSICEVYF